MSELMDDLVYQSDAYWHDPNRGIYDLRSMAFVETDQPQGLAGYVSRTAVGPAESVAVTRYEPQRVELVASLQHPGLVILADTYYPGWNLTIDGLPAPIYRTNRLMRGAAVKAGRHTLVYTYDPDSFRIGGALSIAGLVALAAPRPLGPGSAGPLKTEPAAETDSPDSSEDFLDGIRILHGPGVAAFHIGGNRFEASDQVLFRAAADHHLHAHVALRVDRLDQGGPPRGDAHKLVDTPLLKLELVLQDDGIARRSNALQSRFVFVPLEVRRHEVQLEAVVVADRSELDDDLLQLRAARRRASSPARR